MADIHLLQIKDERGRKVSLELMSKGLTVHHLLVERPGFPSRNLMCGPESTDEYAQEGRRFKNQVVGRYTNRLAGGQTSIETREGKHLSLNLERNDHGKNCLHSGLDGYDLRKFERVSGDSEIVQSFKDDPSNPSEISLDETGQRAFFHLDSPANDQGFPESIDILATVTLSAAGKSEADSHDKPIMPLHSLLGRLTFSLQAKIREPLENSEQSPIRGTPINLTWHNGYILNDFELKDKEDSGISQYKLGILGEYYVEVDEELLPTGELRPASEIGIVSNGNFITGEGVKLIDEQIPKDGFDHCIVLKEPGKPELPKVTLRSPSDDLVMNFRTNQTAVQCYSSNFFDGSGFRKKLHQNQSTHKGYSKQDALYLEFQQPSGICQNKKMQEQLNINNGRDNSSVLYPGEMYNNWFSIDIYAKDV
ncbi:galactose mutarotase-like domain-containing protein [Melampsora americana]|nr:galactose mutarotase-like domain-containing protein [Melampsora americana]